jgi:hypothetical protein
MRVCPRGGIAFFSYLEFSEMGSLQVRIAAYADASANLLTQLTELDVLREQVRKAELSSATPEPLKRPASINRRDLAASANSRQISRLL